MDIKLDEVIIEAELNKVLCGVIATMMGGYKVQEAIGKHIAQDVIAGALGQAIDAALKDVDISGLKEKIAAALTDSMLVTVQAILEEGLMTTICKLKNIGDYSPEDKAERAALRESLFPHRKE